jgi:Flp pilus assembly pilin Flp
MNYLNAWATALVLRMQDLKSDRGQTLVEYALVLGVIVVALIGAFAFTGLATKLGTAVTAITTAL